MQSDFEQYAGEIRDGLMADAEWEPPIPFDEVHTPDFPVEKLPGPLEAMVEHLAESTQTPEEMSGLLSLEVLATAFQSKYEVQITPDWREPLCLYVVAVAPPGERKSAVIAALTRPIYEYEAEQTKVGRKSARRDLKRNGAGTIPLRLAFSPHFPAACRTMRSSSRILPCSCSIVAALAL